MMIRTAFATLIVCVSPFAQASAAEWKADKSHSAVNFSIAHLVISTVTGRFRDFEATMVSTNDDFTDASIQATIKTESIDTGVEDRDKRLRSDDFLNVADFPLITFKSASIETTGVDRYKITGNLTIRNITKAVVLDTKYKGTILDQGKTRAAFEATTTIDRFEYGVKWDKTIETGGLVAGKDIDITLFLEFVKQK